MEVPLSQKPINRFYAILSKRLDRQLNFINVKRTGVSDLVLGKLIRLLTATQEYLIKLPFNYNYSLHILLTFKQ